MSVLKIKNDKGAWVEITTIQGEPGRTPVVGVDYFTNEDKKEFLDEVQKDIVVNAENINYAGEIEDINNIQDAIDFIYDYAVGTDTVEDIVAAALANIGVAEDGAY